MNKQPIFPLYNETTKTLLVEGTPGITTMNNRYSAYDFVLIL